jgi:hypothetical protein
VSKRRIFDWLCLCSQHRLIGRAADGDDFEIQFRRGAAVQPDFLAAEESALFQRRKIEKAQLQRFLDLVDEISGQEDPGDVRLDPFDFVDRVRVGIRIPERFDQFRMHGRARFVLFSGEGGRAGILRKYCCPQVAAAPAYSWSVVSRCAFLVPT